MRLEVPTPEEIARVARGFGLGMLLGIALSLLAGGGRGRS